MDPAYKTTLILSIFSGLIGGVASHATWLIKTLRKSLENKESVTVSKTAVNSRTALLALSLMLGVIGGFIAGNVVHDQQFGIGALVGIAFAAGFSIDTIISRSNKL